MMFENHTFGITSMCARGQCDNMWKLCIISSDFRILIKKIQKLLQILKNFMPESYQNQVNIQLDESTAPRHLKSLWSLLDRSLHLILVTKRSRSWSWMTPFCSMSIGPRIAEIRLFQNLTLKIQGHGHGQGQTQWLHLMPRIGCFKMQKILSCPVAFYSSMMHAKILANAFGPPGAPRDSFSDFGLGGL